MSENTETFEPVSQQADYFGFSSAERYYLPDGVSYIEFEIMNEGKRARFQKQTSRDMVLDRRSGNARIAVNTAEDRHALINESCVGWNLKRNGRDVPFNAQSLRDFLSLADPKVVDGLELAIRKANPWMMGDLTSEEVREQIKELEELLKVTEEREAGEASSANK